MTSCVSLDSPVRYLEGVGPKRAELFAGLGIKTIEDLFFYLPRRYEDRTNFTPVSKLQEGQFYTIKANVLVKGERRSMRRRGFSITQAIVGDQTGRVNCVWFNQPYLRDYLKVGTSLILYGRVEKYSGRLQMTAPEFEVSEDENGESLNIGRIVPIYPALQGLGQRSLRKIIKAALDGCVKTVNDFLPYDIRSRNGLLNLAKSILNIHFPEDQKLREEALRRLSFDEFLLFELPLVLRKSRKQSKPGVAHKINGELSANFMAGLPFTLTGAQKKALEEIMADMAKPACMQRLLQGDVGSGKTVVATIASLIAVQGGYQAAFLAPTEILARQHYEKISAQAPKVRIGLLTSSIDAKEKELIYSRIRAGQLDLIIGTHSLLEEQVKFSNLGLVVIDEQHKFGVGQRALLPQKGPNPDILIMTATPIPRTLAITIYADLDVSVIRELPGGRKPITTKWLKNDKREELYGLIRQELKKGRQAYIVYPVIEESYALDLLSAKKMYEDLKSNVFKDVEVGLIHGRLKKAEQEKVMSAFVSGKIKVLVATTVLEVGIDVANASIMVIEEAQRFGLSQLHQLRGRIGRGPYDSLCVVVSGEELSEEAVQRLSALVKYSDGFRISEEDLKIRGPGEFFGKRQHGLTDLKIANPLTQLQLLKKAREEAIRIIERDPHLSDKDHLALKDKLLQRFPEYDRLVMT